MTWYPWFKIFLGGGKSLVLKIIWKLLDKRSFQTSSSSNNQWIHASQPFRSESMKYKMHVFNFPSSPSLNAFFFLFWVSPHGSRPCEPIKGAVHSHLPPRASQQSQLHHSILDYVEPFQSWVAGFAKTAVGLHKHLEEGKMWGRLRHSSTPFYWKKQLWSSPVRESKQKLAVLSAIQQQAFNWIFPHGSHNPSTKGEAPSPTPTLRGRARSLHALFSWSNSAQFNPEWNKRESSPLTHSAFHYWLSRAVLSSFSNLLSTPGKKKAMFISERQAPLGSAARISVRLGWTG